MKRFALVFFAGFSLSSMAQASMIQLRSVQSNGSGCPIAVNPSIPYGFDGEWLTFNLQQAKDMQVLRGPGVSLEESRRQCAFTLDLRVPQGYSFALERVLVWGQQAQAANDQLVTTTEAFFAGSGVSVKLEQNIEHPGSSVEPFFVDQWVPAQEMLWSDCRTDRAFTVNTSLRISSQMRSLQFSQAEADKLALKLKVRKCR